MDAQTAALYREGLARALAAGAAVLKGHGTAMDAVQAAVESLEFAIFNAGRGAAFAADGTNEMDASIMNGSDQRGGGVACVIDAAPDPAGANGNGEDAVRADGGCGRRCFLEQQGLEQQPPSFFFTEMRWKEFEGVMREKHLPIPKRPAGAPGASLLRPDEPSGDELFAHRYGTVGAVARDSEGHIAAGTSTGGMQGKLPGRVGDSPILGAGTYADDAGCAISGTGVGEYFIRLSLAIAWGNCAARAWMRRRPRTN